LDSSAYIEMRAGDQRITETLAYARQVCLSTIALGELLAGFPPGTRWEAGKADLDDFLKARQVRMLCPDANTALEYARLFNDAKQSGRMLPTNDLWIAATAVQDKAVLLTTDGHFTELPIECLLLD